MTRAIPLRMKAVVTTGHGGYDKLVNKYDPGIRRYFPEFFARAP